LHLGLLLLPAAVGAAERAAADDVSAAAFVGAGTCVECHVEQGKDWTGSHHDLAMQEAAEDTVLGDFADASLTQFGVTSTFYRANDKFMVRTEGADGKLGDFEIRYVFGVHPLQQYLIEFSGGAPAGPQPCLGYASAGPGRAALVPSLPGREDHARRRVALDQAEPELEQYVRRVPFDQSAEKLRPCVEILLDHLV